MTEKRSSRRHQPPLSPLVVRAIEHIEPPPAAPDFWSRLEESVAADGEVPPDTLDDGRPGFGTRTAVLAAAAVILVIAVSFAILQFRGENINPDVMTGPADDLPDGQTPVTEPDAETSGDEESDPPLTVTIDGDGGDNGNGNDNDNDDPQTEGADDGSAPSDSDQTTSPSTADSDNGQTTPVPTTPTPDPSSEPPTSDSPTTDEPGTDEVAPIRLEAEAMAIMTEGIDTDDGWNLFSAGYIQDTVDITETGQYRITVQAKGFSTGGTEPEMELRIGGVIIDRTTVALGDYRDYVFVASLTEGQQPLRVAFTNDPNTPDDDVDLTIDGVTLRFLG